MSNIFKLELQHCLCGANPKLYSEGVYRDTILQIIGTGDTTVKTPSGYYRKHGYFVECPVCGLRTEPSISPKDAVNEWNCKATLVPTGKVITLCGSARFKDQLDTARKKLTLEGHIVMGPELYVYSGHTHRKMLDELHKRKIAMSDEIFVVNVGGYIGKGTAMAIALAEHMGKTVKYLEEEPSGKRLADGSEVK